MVRVRAAGAAVVLAGGILLPVLDASPAAANCDAPRVTDTFTEVERSRRLSNLRSDYLRGPGTITYTKATTASTSAQMSSQVSAEAGVLFAKASTSIGVAVGKDWSRSGSWSCAKPVPRDRTARLVMWHESRRFVVNEYTLACGCRYTRAWSSRTNAPLRSNTNLWSLQYR